MMCNTIQRSNIIFSVRRTVLMIYFFRKLKRKATRERLLYYICIKPQ